MALAEKCKEYGAIARVSFQADNGYSILRIERADFSEFTAVGVLPDAAKGLDVELQGEWKIHPKFGKQFAFSGYSVPQPTTKEGALSFLETLKGVGRSLAERMYEAFGDRVFTVLEESPDELLTVNGIAHKKLGKLTESYQKSKGLRDLIAFLADVGVSPTYANRIYRVYGNGAIGEIKKNPYILAEEVRGFGFKKADEVARSMGIDQDSKVRCVAALMHVLKLAASRQGHCFLLRDTLYSEACDVLSLPGYRPQMSDIEKVIGSLQSQKTGRKQRLVVDGDRIYLYAYFEAEEHLAIALKLLSGEIQCDVDVSKWIAGYQERNGIELSNGQRVAVETSARYGLSVVTGGAGVGKTATSKAIIQLWHDRKKRVIAAAPTGKAAQRIKEATGLSSASTIHRLLGWNGSGFEHNMDNPLEGDAFLIDEFSMADLKLANALFQAIPPHAQVLIVGDVNQLPSVGAGNVLRDVIESQQVPVVRLTEVFRQAATSRIIQASLSINKGQFPELEQVSRASGEPTTDMLWVKCGGDRIQEAITWLVTEQLPGMGWRQDDIQLLSPQHKGTAGNIELNKLIQTAWNPPLRGKASVSDFRVGDRVIQTSNDYDKNVFNGDIGKIEKIDPTDKECVIRFPDLDNPQGKAVTYDFADMDDVMLAYSISIHKSQGSEFPVIIIPCSMQHYMMLQRNLLYTGVTRGKKLVVLVGEEKAIATAVRTNKLNARNTALIERLGGEACQQLSLN